METETLQQASRQREQIEDLCSVAIRAFTGQGEHYYHGGKFFKGHRQQHLFAAHLKANPRAEEMTLENSRGIADSIVLRLEHNDAELHKQHCPEEGVERLVFELLEQLRVDSLAPADFPGMKINVDRRFEEWSERFYRSGVTQTSIGNLLYTLAHISWAQLNDCDVLAASEEHIASSRAGIKNMLQDDLLALKQSRSNQSLFAQHALSVTHRVSKLIAAEKSVSIVTDINPAQEVDIESVPEFEMFVDFDESEYDGIRRFKTGGSKAFEENNGVYKVFSREFDTVEAVEDLVKAEKLLQLRHKLDQRILGLGINVGQLARRLRQLFAVPQRDDWSFGEEEGYIDGSRLSQLISSPMDHRLFKQARYVPMADAMVTLLVDCSGSMKKYSDDVPVLLDLLGRALEKAGIACEILGFTTHGWNGGRLTGKWAKAGRPEAPGRLNELCHMVFKDADSSWRQSRNNVGALLNMALYRENIDGEAIDWACERLLTHDVGRRVLLVITDGTPLDTATSQANDKYYLDNHLKNVVSQHDQQGIIDVIGLGVGLDLSPFYRRCHALDLSEGLSTQAMLEVLDLLAKKK